MNDIPEMESFDEIPEADESAMMADPMAMAPMAVAGPMPPHKQLFQFMWGAVAVLFGCLLRFNTHAAGWDDTTYMSELQGPMGLMTVGGSVAAFCAMLVIGAQWYCMRFRRVMLGPIVIMMLVAAWSWFKVVPGFACGNLGLSADVTEPNSWTAMFYNGDTFVDFWSHVGPGHLFILVGSTYVSCVFLGALLGVGAKKKDATPDAAPARGRGRRR